MQLLLHLPSPQKFASDQPAADYSLRLLEQLARHSWLNTLIIILYKVCLFVQFVFNGTVNLIKIPRKNFTINLSSDFYDRTEMNAKVNSN